MTKDKIHLFEVSPRDGLQNEKIIPTQDKVELINNLANAGVKFIESGSFVSPKWIPQMADSNEVLSTINRKQGVCYSALTPNLQGLNNAIKVNVDEVAIFTSASETFTQKNINCSIDESIKRFIPVVAHAKDNNLPVRGYVSCTLGCPYEHEISIKQVVEVCSQLHELGVYQISLGDTIGIGTPSKAKQMVSTIMREIPKQQLALHFHDTYGQALANIHACLDLGITTIDAAVAGIGGCPYAKGASGNVASEDLIYMLHGMGYETGIDLALLIKAGNKISRALGRQNTAKVAMALTGN